MVVHGITKWMRDRSCWRYAIWLTYIILYANEAVVDDLTRAHARTRLGGEPRALSHLFFPSACGIHQKLETGTKAQADLKGSFEDHSEDIPSRQRTKREQKIKIKINDDKIKKNNDDKIQKQMKIPNAFLVFEPIAACFRTPAKAPFGRHLLRPSRCQGRAHPSARQADRPSHSLQ